MPQSFRIATLSDAEPISRLINSLARYFLDDPSSADAKFLAAITPESLAERIAAPNFLHIVAEDDGELCGVVAMRDQTHLYHLFVKSGLHKQGIARALCSRAMAQSNGSRFTVNSSLYAAPVYQRLGFVATGAPQTSDGVTYQPMVCTKDD